MAYDFNLDDELQLEQELFHQEAEDFNEDEVIASTDTVTCINLNPGDTTSLPQSGLEYLNGNNFKSLTGKL